MRSLWSCVRTVAHGIAHVKDLPPGLIIILFTLTITTVFLFMCPAAETKEMKAKRAIKQRQDIITGKGNGDPVKKNRLTGLESRARPNQRLVHSFGIDNAFTTVHNERRIEFKREAHNKLSIKGDAWKRHAGSAKGLVARVFDAAKADYANTVDLVPFVQRLTLSTVLQIIFGMDALLVDGNSVKVVAEEINRLWTQSKETGNVQRFTDQKQLKDALSVLFPEFQYLTPKDNPLNWILPAYETLWRIVLLAFVEVEFHDNTPVAKDRATQQKWHKALHLFLADPSVNINSAPAVDGLTAIHISKEALRLYPSTKRVYRHLEVVDISDPDSTPIPVDCSADVEASHRDPTIWGPSGAYFDPARWIVSNEPVGNSLRGEAYMPFGVKPFLCPASREFGFKIIALLLAALSDGLHSQSEEWLLDGHLDEYKNEALPSNRDSVRIFRSIVRLCTDSFHSSNHGTSSIMS